MGMPVPIDQKAYLKKYLSGGSKSKKGKKKKGKHEKSKKKGLSLVEDTADINDLPFGFAEEDDAPTIAEITYESEKVKELEDFRSHSNKWKNIEKSNSNRDSAEESGILLGHFNNSDTPLSTVSGDREGSNGRDSLALREEEKRHIYAGRDSNMRSSVNGDQARGFDHSPPRKKRHDSDSSSPKKKRHDSDESPRRRKRHDSDTSPRRKRHDSDASPTRKKPYSRGSSPPRRKRHDSDISPLRSKRHDSDASPPRKKRHDSDGSPPRRKRHDSDGSPPRRKRHDSDASPSKRKRHDSDASPPRRKRHDSDASPSRRKRHDSDASPPRRKRHDSDASPSRRKRHDSDASPPKRKRHDSDASPPRRKRHDSDASPPRRRRHDSDTSPPRRKRNDSDASPPRRKRHDSDNSPPRKKNATDPSSRKTKTDAGERPEKKMTTSEYLKARKYGRLKKDTPEDLLRQEREAALQKKAEQKYKEWNKGLTQKRQERERIEDVVHEMGKTFARSADDKDMNKKLKEVMREEDPMLEYIMKKKAKDDPQKQQRPTYNGPFPPNRFRIRPGYRWDGVDRSSGFEKEWFDRQNAKRAVNSESYKWSTEDM